MNENRRSPCPVSCVLDLVGDRWTLLVVRDLLHGKRYFDEFLESPEGIASNILAARLSLLCQEGYAQKTRDPQDGRRFAYTLTDRGEKLRRLVRLVAIWGLQHIPNTEVMPDLTKEDGDRAVNEQDA